MVWVGKQKTGGRRRAMTGSREDAFVTRWREDGSTIPRAQTTGGLKRTSRSRTRDMSRVRSRIRTRSRARSASVASVRTRTRVKKRSATGVIDREYYKTRTTLTRRRPSPKQLIPYQITRYQGVRQEIPDQDPEGTGARSLGYFPLLKGDPNSATTSFEVPLNMYELTSIDNTTAASYRAGWKLAFGDGGAPVWLAVNPQFPDGTPATGGNWQIDDVRQWGQDNQFGGCTKLQHAWYDIRAKLYGCRKQPVTYDIMLVKFSNPNLIPLEFKGISGAVQTVRRDPDDAAQYAQFWQNLVRNQIVNTILPGTSSTRRGFIVLRKRRFVLQAASNDELDRNPKSIDVKWFVRDNRILNYTMKSAPFLSDVAVNTVQWNQRLAAQTSNVPRDGSRLFLLIRATDMTQVKTDDDWDDSPSFDLVMRRKTYGYTAATL